MGRRAEHQLAALADGSLPEPRAAALHARVAADPALAAALAEQRRGLTLIRRAAEELEAPLALRAYAEDCLGAGKVRSWGSRPTDGST